MEIKLKIFLLFIIQIQRTLCEENICLNKNCACETRQDEKGILLNILTCRGENLRETISIWPEEFRRNESGSKIVASFFQKELITLEQLPSTNSELIFSCRKCKIKEIQAAAFLKCQKIKSIDLAYNELTGDSLVPDIFRGPYNEFEYQTLKLEELDLSHNQITNLDPKMFEHTPQLRRINLAFNQLKLIEVGSVDAINSISNLEFISLENNGLLSLPSNIFKSLKSLKILNLKSNKFKVFPTFNKSRIQVIDISNNLLERIDSETFHGLEELKSLKLSYNNNLVKIKPGSFSSLKNLERLYCNNNQNLINIHLPTESKYLKLLDISNCALTNVFMDINLINSTSTSIPWSMIQVMKLFGNPWNCNCVLIEIFDKYKEILDESQMESNLIPRCSSPFKHYGKKLSYLNVTEVCTNEKLDKFLIPPTLNGDSKHFKTYFRTIISVIVFTILGLCIGFSWAYLQKKLKNKNIFEVSSSVRYASIKM